MPAEKEGVSPHLSQAFETLQDVYACAVGRRGGETKSKETNFINHMNLNFSPCR